ncbi:gas vesicle protein K [Planctomycetaceae bacterium SH139]
MVITSEELQPCDASPLPKIEINAENAAAGIGRLALAIVNLLHELLERQAIRRMDNGTITDEEVENVGVCLQKQSAAIDQLCESFGVSRDDLNLDLGALGKLV